ncbi:MAG: UDP-N-acetylmuramoyl-L-alanine--D-glutamate ligase [Bacteroidales bacterium]|nr:UDP-N-acetylmuramoyl-L-alanine--D-glutamate ligase [Bacteroidales bacterium]
MARVVILGAGESGTGAAVLAMKKNHSVFVSDTNKIKNKYKEVLLHHKIEFEEGMHSEKVILDADEIIKSPGIPNNIEILLKARKKNISIISEIEFAARYTEAKLIGVTGTNGKTTTASMIFHIFNHAGYDVCLAGNVGKSFALALSERDYKYFVLELSSFQLEDMFSTRLNVAILLNITPDHLDRYNYELSKYVDAKFRILLNQTSEDVFIYWADDEVIMSEIAVKLFHQEIIPFSVKNENKNGAYLKNNQMYVNYNSDKFNMFVEDFSFKGTHNILNAMASSITASRNNIRKEKIKESLTNFSNIEHRLEMVCKIRGVEYINDSKATNVNSTWYALESYKNPIIWIAGGIDKGNNYELIHPLVKQKVKALICLSLDNSKLKEAFSKDVGLIKEATSMEEAVNLAYQEALPGDVVLLSPACSSFDLFENYEDRGNQFKKVVMNL